MSKQTAVEYLAEKYNYITWMRNRDEISAGTADEWRAKFLKEAKEMEKEQITNAYMDGYNEAMRFRDPKQELPEEGIDVFVKVIRSGEYGDETIYTSSHVVNDFYHDSESNPFGCEGYYTAGNGGRIRVAVVGWRPIE